VCSLSAQSGLRSEYLAADAEGDVRESGDGSGLAQRARGEGERREHVPRDDHARGGEDEEDVSEEQQAVQERGEAVDGVEWPRAVGRIEVGEEQPEERAE